MPVRAISNPPNPWHTSHVEWIDAPPPATLKVFEEQAKSIVSENTSPDIGFRYSVNPYRGCFHACAYCYARPTHQYLDFGAGTDFERKIVVKTNAAQLLRKRFMRRSWSGELVVFSGNTDCYQPLEASYGITRELLQVCAEFANPVGIITKSAIVRRDVDVLCAIDEVASAKVNVSIPFFDKHMARAIEPNAPTPKVRLDAVRALADAGLDVGVAVAPIIPGLNDSQIVQVLEAAADAGARRAWRIMIRLPAEVKPVFLERLNDTYPERTRKVVNGITEMRGGQLYRNGFHSRMVGRGERWDATARLFDVTCKRLGLNLENEEDALSDNRGASTFRRPGEQLALL